MPFFVRSVKIVSVYWNLLKGQCHDIQWFFAHFLREQKMAAARASVADISSVCRANSFTAQAVSSKCHFSQQLSFFAAFPCGRHYFSPQKMAAKTHRLSWHCRFKKWNSTERCLFLTFLCLHSDLHCACAQKRCRFSYFSRAFKQKAFQHFSSEPSRSLNNLFPKSFENSSNKKKLARLCSIIKTVKPP